MIHQSVLLQETITSLSLVSGAIVVDATGGAGGHSEAILAHIGVEGKLYIIDQDTQALFFLKEKFGGKGNVTLLEGNFRSLDALLEEAGCQRGGVRAFLFDIGFSSDQIESSGKGFSFLKDEPLLMTMSDNSSPDAMTIVNTWGEAELADLFFKYGDEQFSRRIAHGIVESRKKAPLTTTFELVRVITDSVPEWYTKRRIHPATKTFQALRIQVNDELNSLREGLSSSLSWLAPHGRISVITFHSGEDTLVKNTFRDWEREGKGKRVNKRDCSNERRTTY